MSRPLYVGIDLGTTNSTACAFDGTQLALIRNPQGTTLTPSVVHLDAKGKVSVGAKARRYLEADPSNTRSEFKRLMGTTTPLDFPGAKQTRMPEQLGAEVLKSLLADVKEQLGVTPECAVISVPALFELPQSAATSEAARLAGLKRVELIQEPVASALASGWEAEGQSGAWLVYDLGGGTFDASLLETRDGLLRVVGHDGDNFLGGRDFDWALVDVVLAELAQASGKRVTRDDPAHATALRRLKLAVEEAKIELTRGSEASVLLPSVFTVDGEPLDVDVTLTRELLAKATLPLVDRSIAVCERLLRAHGLEPAQISRLVLVGGPTVIPFLRKRLTEALRIPFAEGADPMTLVAQGAALYAATAGLDARPKAAPEPSALSVWLQYPAMSSDLMPHVAGRFAKNAEPKVTKVRLTREAAPWESPLTELSPEGAFVLPVELKPRQANVFRLEALGDKDQPLAVTPASFTIVHGLTIGDPPLSRTLGVALADDHVRVYFERGAPLPARRTFRHRTVDSVAPSSPGFALQIPIIQGELEQAHLCRHVGTLEIPGEKLKQALPAGSQVEVTLELDRGGRLSARALLPATGQIFEEVAHLSVPDASPETLTLSLNGVRERVAMLRGEALRHGVQASLDALAALGPRLQEIENDIRACRGGDADAGQKARRSLIELEADLEGVEMQNRFLVDAEAMEELASAASLVSMTGSPEEKRLLDEASARVLKARSAQRPQELQRELRVVRRLSNAAYFRLPNAWSEQFEIAASRISESTDLAHAQKLVSEGRRAQDTKDEGGLRRITEELRELLPSGLSGLRLGHGSGVR